MSGTIMVGAQWGDEGKGKVSDFLSQNSDIVVRFNGGGNAGHTVFFNGEDIKLHYIPSGVFHKKLCVLGNGMVINPKELLDEISLIKKLGIKPMLAISKRAHVILSYHTKVDKVRGKAIGTTGKGIGPAYADKMERVNLRFGDLSKESAYSRVKEAIESKKDLLIAEGIIEKNGFDNFTKSLSEEYAEYGKKLSRYTADTYLIIRDAFKNNRSVLFEGAQGVMLDIDFGTYPFVTSSNTIAQGALTGAGVNPAYIKRVVGVSKAYVTRVGEGPFPTELNGEKENLLRHAGNEFGATTGRPRRVGYLDLVALKYAVNISGIKEIALTKMDILSALDKIKVAVEYSLNGKRISAFPFDANTLYQIKPIYKNMEPIEYLSKEEWENLKEKPKSNLPEGIRNYIGFIEKYLGIPVTILSFGPEGGDTITYENT